MPISHTAAMTAVTSVLPEVCAAVFAADVETVSEMIALFCGKAFRTTVAGTVCVSGTRLKMLSTEKGQISLRAAIPQRAHFAHAGIFLNMRRSTMTAAIIYPAVMLISSTFKNTASISVFFAVDDPHYFIDILVGKLLPLGKRRNKRGQGAFKLFLHKLV